MKPIEVDLFVDLTDQHRRGTQRPWRAGPRTSTRLTRCRTRAGSPTASAIGRSRLEDIAQGAEHVRWSRGRRLDDHLVEERRVTPGFTVKDNRAALVSQVRSARLPRDGHRHGSGRDQADVGARYNVPENHIAYLRREQLVVGEGAKFTPPGRKPRAMRPGDIDKLLQRANREPDGSTRRGQPGLRASRSAACASSHAA